MVFFTFQTGFNIEEPPNKKHDENSRDEVTADWLDICMNLDSQLCIQDYDPATCKLGKTKVLGSNQCTATIKLQRYFCEQEIFTRSPNQIKCYSSDREARDEKIKQEWEAECNAVDTRFCTEEYSPAKCNIHHRFFSFGTNGCEARINLAKKICDNGFFKFPLNHIKCKKILRKKFPKTRLLYVGTQKFQVSIHKKHPPECPIARCFAGPNIELQEKNQLSCDNSGGKVVDGIMVPSDQKCPSPCDYNIYCTSPYKLYEYSIAN